MSRLINAHKPSPTSFSPSRQLTDSDPVLLLSDAAPHSTTPTDSQTAHTPAPAEATPDQHVPFIEIPEEDIPIPAPPPRADLPGTPLFQLRFQAGKQTENDLGTNGATSALAARLAHQAQIWRPEIQKFADQIRRQQVQKILLVSGLPPSTSHHAIPAIAWGLLEQVRPLLLIESTPSLGLHTALGRAPAPGLTDWLASLPLPCAVQSTPHPDWHYLAPGHDLAYTHRRFLTQDWKTPLAELTSRYSLIVFAADLASPHALALAFVADAVAFLLDDTGQDFPTESRVLAIQACAPHHLGYLFLQAGGS
jgi:hypothetical protein